MQELVETEERYVDDLEYVCKVQCHRLTPLLFSYCTVLPLIVSAQCFSSFSSPTFQGLLVFYWTCFNLIYLFRQKSKRLVLLFVEIIIFSDTDKHLILKGPIFESKWLQKYHSNTIGGSAVHVESISY